MEFLSSFPDTEFELSRYFSMDHDQEEQADHHYFFHSQVGQQVSSFPPGDPTTSIDDQYYCSSCNNLMNHSPSSNCSSNNSAAVFDPAAAAVTNYCGDGDYQSFDNFLPEQEAANLAMDFCVMEEERTSAIMLGNINNPAETVVDVASMDCQPLKRKLINTQQSPEEEIAANPSDKKRPRATKDNKGKKTSGTGNTQWKKNQKCINIVNDNEEESKNNVGINCGREGQSSSSWNSEEENVLSHEQYANSSNNIMNGDSKAQKSNRASRGSATDPQSLYARKRRERINERLRILQNLVPNGTKVDISTMLEEAVHYVKFLQIQIKLLSSDDMWMYAPIAYNGVDVGLNEKFSSLL